MSLHDAITEGIDSAATNLGIGAVNRDRIVESVLAAVNAAVARGDFITFDTPGTGHPGFGIASQDTVNLIAEGMAETLTQTPAPVATIDATEVIAMLAASAHRMNPVVPDTDTDDTAMGIEVILGETNHRAFRQFLFAVQPLFGVRTRVSVTDGEATFTVGGLRDDVRAFRLVTETFARVADTLPAESTVDQEVLWATIGAMAAGTDRAQAQIVAATDRFTNATTYVRTLLGPARTLPRATAAESGEVRDLAVAALADAATAL